ncbi:hypothetical protein E4582_02905 [Luteimonas yindakuii]|uniref:MBL fold metallo-hydrolase n=1 Tax=Luteimonas yindakuii TaxID=2565782 RepID=A0A4Z1R5L0_9GAMM|nr:hypothetical protein [Luteimonas yindakuii]TKS53825.1 hypothetical protein E4582_02905 [Luteimonas yindakuii]
MQQLADTFWNLRGVYRVGGVLDIGTQMSLVRRPNGRFVVIDGCALDDAQRSALLALTGDGAQVDAVVHVHPFHTLHVEATHRLFPSARLHGTARHRRLFPSLPWSEAPMETWGGEHPFADMFDLSVPAGVDFDCPDERVHVASVLVRHRHSGIVHVDDTFNVIAAPGRLGAMLPQSSLRMHPMLARALRPERGAADAYAAWARALASHWADTRIVCAAHSAVRHLPAGGFAREVEGALERVSDTLERHRRRHG